MPLYEGDSNTRDDLEKIRKRNVCLECGGRLVVLWDMNEKKAFLTCSDYRRTNHEGIIRESSRFEKEGLASLNIESRREIMEQDHGEEKTRELVQSRAPLTGALTQPQAMHILKLVYPKVPEDEIIRTAIFCRDYGLHPLAKEVFIIPFKNKAGGNDYAMVVGIPASRKIAHALKGEFSFLDDTPRAASEEEIAKQFGKNSEESQLNIISVTKLQGEGGNLAIGFGLYPKTATPKGTEKGNTKRNMANIRSERQAMDRLPGKAIPKVEVVDERYIDVDYKVIDSSTGEVLSETASTTVAPSAETTEHWCQEHECAFELKKGRFGPFYAHALEGAKGKKWCNEPKNKAEAPPASTQELSEQAAPEPETVEGEFIEVPETIPSAEEITQAENLPDAVEQPDVDADPNRKATQAEIDSLKDAMAEKKKDAKWLGTFCNVERGWKIQKPADLTRYQLDLLFEELNK